MAKLVYVIPRPALARRGDNLPGIPAAGAFVAPELAEEWRRAGLVTIRQPAAKAAPKEA